MVIVCKLLQVLNPLFREAVSPATASSGIIDPEKGLDTLEFFSLVCFYTTKQQHSTKHSQIAVLSLNNYQQILNFNRTNSKLKKLLL